MKFAHIRNLHVIFFILTLSVACKSQYVDNRSPAGLANSNISASNPNGFNNPNGFGDPNGAYDPNNPNSSFDPNNPNGSNGFGNSNVNNPGGTTIYDPNNPNSFNPGAGNANPGGVPVNNPGNTFPNPGNSTPVDLQQLAADMKTCNDKGHLYLINGATGSCLPDTRLANECDYDAIDDKMSDLGFGEDARTTVFDQVKQNGLVLDQCGLIGEAGLIVTHAVRNSNGVTTGHFRNIFCGGSTSAEGADTCKRLSDELFSTPTTTAPTTNSNTSDSGASTGSSGNSSDNTTVTNESSNPVDKARDFVDDLISKFK